MQLIHFDYVTQEGAVKKGRTTLVRAVQQVF